MSDPLEMQIRMRRADSRRLFVGSVLGLVAAMMIGALLWLTTGNLALGAAVGGILGILLPGPGAAIARRRK
jgi:Mg/Co/Ni transporter MgtE